MLIRIYLAVSALGLAGFGLAIMIAPIEVFASADLTMADLPSIRTELRAFYGGLEIALSALVFAAMARGRLADGLLLSFAIYGGIGLARGAGMLLEGEGTTFLWSALAFELGMGAIGLLLWRRQP